MHDCMATLVKNQTIFLPLPPAHYKQDQPVWDMKLHVQKQINEGQHYGLEHIKSERCYIEVQ